jgi:hypothetical protein
MKDGELWRRTGKVGWQKTLEDLEKLLEEAKELCEKRSGDLLLSRIILGSEEDRMQGELDIEAWQKVEGSRLV